MRIDIRVEEVAQSIMAKYTLLCIIRASNNSQNTRVVLRVF